MPTLQETFDKVATHLLSQKEKAINCDGTCMYRQETDGGIVLKCAAGCLIEDEDYKPEMEFQTVDGKFPYGKDSSLCLVKNYFLDKEYDVQFIQKLQNIHDDFEPYEWKVKLQELAILNQLNYQSTLI